MTPRKSLWAQCRRERLWREKNLRTESPQLRNTTGTFKEDENHVQIIAIKVTVKYNKSNAVMLCWLK
jgi:hypothetical protein